MAKPNVTCATCEKPMVSVRPQGVAKCNPCSSMHGTQGRYKRGCRCGECRAAATKRVGEWAKVYTEREGVSPWVTGRARKAEAEGREYVPEVQRMVPCAVCGEAVLKRDYSSAAPSMHRACRASLPNWRRRPGGVSPARRRFVARAAKAAAGKPASKRVFVQGPCSWCGEPFCSPAGEYCSPTCRVSARESRRHPMKFNPTPRLRREVYERDGWVCGLCDLPIDSSLAWPHKWSASLDHVVPQSHMLIPDHSASNLRAVHLQCNSMRGDGSNMSEDELRRRAASEIGGGRLVGV